jgi:hypothetical protein
MKHLLKLFQHITKEGVDDNGEKAFCFSKERIKNYYRLVHAGS